MSCICKLLRSPGRYHSGLTFHAYKLLQHFIRYSDDLRVRLETSLGCDDVGELVGKVYVGHFQVAAEDTSRRA